MTVDESRVTNESIVNDEPESSRDSAALYGADAGSGERLRAPGFDFGAARHFACDLAARAGDALRAELHRPGGARVGGATAPIDLEVETEIRQQLAAAYPEHGFRGEETGFSPPGASANPTFIWLVDPNDGTSALLRGHRGTTVSIALLRDTQPVLGVVYAFAAPDDDGDLFAWAEGTGPLLRNGKPQERPPWPPALGAESIVLLSHGADLDPVTNIGRAYPARYRKAPGIAHRLALVAAGEADACVSNFDSSVWDYAAGHALLRSVGGDFLDQAGQPVTYSPTGESHTSLCVGGAPLVVADYWRRPWTETIDDGRKTDHSVFALTQPAPGQLVSDAPLLRRAQGCLLGQLVGDALGSLVEFRSVTEIRRAYPGGIRRLHDGGTWNTLAGQPTDDSEMALMLARSLARDGAYDRESVAQAYLHWRRSDPFDIGGTTSRALDSVTDADLKARRAGERMAAASSRTSQANGSLMRISPLAIWGHRLQSDDLADLARADSSLTHPNSVCQEAVATYVVAIAYAIRTGHPPTSIYDFTLDWATRSCRDAAVLQALRSAADTRPSDFTTQAGWVLIAFGNAFHALLHAHRLEEGLTSTVLAGGDTDTNAAIAGALLGAVHGRDAIPLQWRQMVLSCRPQAGVLGVRRPRPREFWPVDALELAERLLLAKGS